MTKGRNYRLFSSDAEVTIAGGRAHVRDLTAERDVEIGNRPFFPIDTYTPIGEQEALIQYWYAHGQPAEIDAEPAGVVRIRETGGGYAEGRPGGRGTALPRGRGGSLGSPYPLEWAGERPARSGFRRCADQFGDRTRERRAARHALHYGGRRPR